MAVSKMVHCTLGGLTVESADDKDVRGRYEKEILTYAGVRLNGESWYLSLILPL